MSNPFRVTMAALLGLLTASGATAAPITSINGIDYDLAQFTAATVTTNVTEAEIFGSTFDNPNGIDLLTLGELATPQFGFDPGDRITLGIEDGDQDLLTLFYGAPVLIGTGMSSWFVVFEQSGDTVVDPEGLNFEIAFNGGSFVEAWTSASVTATGGVVGAGGTEQNQIVFDLLHSDFGFSTGDVINSVAIRNRVITMSSEDDPDFLFAARAGTDPVFFDPNADFTNPEPSSLVLCAIALGYVGVGSARRRRRRLRDGNETVEA